MLQNITSRLPDSRITLSLVHAAQIKALPLSREVKESSFTECNMMSNVSHSGG